jgi:hypothetical protein
MCLAVYISTKIEIATIPWDNDNPSFFILSIDQRNHHNVEKQFINPNIYYVGSYQGCGCGFIYDENDPEFTDEMEDLNLRSKCISTYKSNR